MKSEATRLKGSNPVDSPKIVQSNSLLEKMDCVYGKITERAHQLFEKRGGNCGQEVEDWLRAEGDLLHPLPIELKEDQDKLIIHAEVPGFTADELQISVEPQRVIICGITDWFANKKEVQTVYTEIHSNEIFRSFDLPLPVSPEKSTVQLKDGILELTLVKEKVIRLQEEKHEVKSLVTALDVMAGEGGPTDVGSDDEKVLKKKLGKLNKELQNQEVTN